MRNLFTPSLQNSRIILGATIILKIFRWRLKSLTIIYPIV